MEEVQTGQAEGVHQAGSPEHINEMLAKVDNGVQPDDVGEELTLQTPTKPEWLPEKFSTPEDLVNAYNQLEQQYTQVSQQQEQEQATQEQIADIQNASVPQVAEILDERGLDIDVFQQEYNETGGLSEDAYHALEEVGISSNVVDTWLAGQEAIADQNINNIYTSYMQFIYENIHICLIVLFSLCSFVWDALIRLCFQENSQMFYHMG